MDKDKHPNNIICPRCGHIGTRRKPRFVKCGKPNCKKCPHGPYYYVAHGSGKTVRDCYLGKTWPEEPSEKAIEYLITSGQAKNAKAAIKLYQSYLKEKRVRDYPQGGREKSP